MSTYQFTPQATSDLLEIWSFIAEDNPTAADEVVEAIFRGCQFLARAGYQAKRATEVSVFQVRNFVEP